LLLNRVEAHIPGVTIIKGKKSHVGGEGGGNKAVMTGGEMRSNSEKGWRKEV